MKSLQGWSILFIFTPLVYSLSGSQLKDGTLQEPSPLAALAHQAIKISVQVLRLFQNGLSSEWKVLLNIKFSALGFLYIPVRIFPYPISTLMA